LHARHQALCAQIVSEEESLVSAHRASLDGMMSSVKGEMELLRRFDGLGCSVDDYVRSLAAALKQKAAAIQKLTHTLETFQAHLKEEEQISRQINRQQQQQCGH